MNTYAISAVINTITVAILGIVVYFKGVQRNISNRYSLFCFFVAIWCYCYFQWQIAEDAPTALFYSRCLMVGAIFIPVSFLDFVLALLDIVQKKKNIVKIGYIIFCFFCIIDFTPLFIKQVSPKLSFKYWPDAGILFTPFLILWLCYCLYPCYLLLQGYRQTTGLRRNQIKYVLVGIIIGYSTGSTNYFLWYNIPVPPVGNFIVPVFVTIMAYAIARYRLMDINIAIRKTLTNIFITLLLVSLMILVNVLGANYGFKITGFVILGILLSLFLPTLKQKTENLIIHILYKGKYDYMDRLERFMEKMVLIPKEKDLIDNTVKVLVRDMYVDNVFLFIIDYITNDYVLRQKTDTAVPDDFRILHGSTIGNWLKNHKGVFAFEEEGKMVSSDVIEEIRQELEPLVAKVCVPVKLESDLMGIIIMGNKSTGEMYNHMDIVLLERLGTQLALALDYKRMELQLRKEQELASIGQLSMEISHELRNLLQSPQTFLDLVLEKKDDVEFMTNFRKMAQDRLKAIRDKLYDIMYFGKERPPNFKSGTSVIDILDSNILANDYSIKKEKVEVVKEYSDIPPIKADSSQLTHLFNNLIINAVDAMHNKGGKIRVRTKTNTNLTKEMELKSERWIRVEIKDDGSGIPQHVLDKLFTPFVTTKSMGNLERSGTGLGLPVIKKVVDSHRGYIYVNTKEEKGTTFVIDLPVDLKTEFSPENSMHDGEVWKK